MKKILCTLLVLTLPLLLSACSSGLDRKLNGPNDQAYAASLGGMKKSSKPAEVAQLDEALLMLAVTDVSIGYEGGILGAYRKLAAEKTPEQLADVLMPLVDGKTGRELIAAGVKRRKFEAARQLAKVERELSQLQKARDERAIAKPLLDAIQILDPTLRFSSAGSQRSSLIEFKVQNSTPQSLSYLYLRGSVAEANGDKTLFADDINYRLSEGLPPGETKQLRLPNMDPGKWNALEIWGRPNLVLKIEVVNAESVPGQKLAPAFSFKDAQRLAALEIDKPQLEKMAAD